MHEIKSSLPADCVPEVVQLARSVGIQRVAVTEIFVHGPDTPARQISIEASTPQAREFVEKFLNSASLSKRHYTLTSRELRAILSDTPVREITVPMCEPFPDIIEDLWQLSHVTASYIGRAIAGGLLLALGILHNDSMAIVVAALFLPFLSEVLALSFGIWIRDRHLVLQGFLALAVSTVSAFVTGIAVAWFGGGPVAFSGFKSPLENFVISAAIGIAAGLSVADDTGRRYLIGVAAAVQLAIFPSWFGEAFVVGLPAEGILTRRVLVFLMNLATIAAGAVIAYAGLNVRMRSRATHCALPKRRQAA